jgi:hypothetical protein
MWQQCEVTASSIAAAAAAAAAAGDGGGDGKLNTDCSVLQETLCLVPSGSRTPATCH